MVSFTHFSFQKKFEQKEISKPPERIWDALYFSDSSVQKTLAKSSLTQKVNLAVNFMRDMQGDFSFFLFFKETFKPIHQIQTQKPSGVKAIKNQSLTN